MSIKPLKEAMYEIVHRSEKPPKQLADETGISYNYLMRASLDTESGCDINIKHVVPLMKAADNYELLKSLNQLCGFLPPVKPPRGTKQGAKKDLSEYQIDFSKMMTKLHEFAASPSEESYKEIASMLRQHMSDTENIRRRAKKNLINQSELF